MSEHRPGDDPDQPASSVIRHEEGLRIGRQERLAGTVRIRTSVASEAVSTEVEREVEHPVTERQPAAENDSGQIEELEDGSLSIPVLEEQLVVTKRIVVRERLIVRKEKRNEACRVDDQLRRERVEITEQPAGEDPH